jgi:hypothetical protein
LIFVFDPLLSIETKRGLTPKAPEAHGFFLAWKNPIA